MKKLSLKTVSFLQAAGIVAYVLLFAGIVQFLGHRYQALQVSPFFSMAMVLMLFVFSATICSAMFLGYPAYLFFDGKKKEAGLLVLRSIAWLAGFLVVFLVVLILVSSMG